MVQLIFKGITVVPSGKEMVDIILSRAQRHTPTVVHNGYAITHLRQFYMRKVQFTKQKFHEKLSLIIDEFPRLEGIHPFYSDLLHALYSKDSYELALDQVNTARDLISKIANDYIRLLKYGDSFYRCKCIKVAALERMCTAIKRIGSSLASLEQIRRHMTRLPLIDPNMPTILEEHYILANDEWKEDIIPEIIGADNVADFVDRDILERLEELEREEGLIFAGDEGDEFKIEGDD